MGYFAEDSWEQLKDSSIKAQKRFVSYQSLLLIYEGLPLLSKSPVLGALSSLGISAKLNLFWDYKETCADIANPQRWFTVKGVNEDLDFELGFISVGERSLITEHNRDMVNLKKCLLIFLLGVWLRYAPLPWTMSKQRCYELNLSIQGNDVRQTPYDRYFSLTFALEP